MIENIKRVGNFCSSTIVSLMAEGKKAGTLGVPALTYITERNMERRLGRTLDKDVDTRPMSWGTLCEPIAFELLPTIYRHCSTETIDHPFIDYWKGTPDAEKIEVRKKTVADIKCPFTLKSFCQFVDLWTLGGMDAIRNGFTDDLGNYYKKHEDGEKFYWQLVSNSILIGATYAELIVYCPYLSELSKIRHIVEGNPSYYWIWSASDEQLPYLPDGGYYKNLYVMRFKVPAKDKAALTQRVQLAGEKLVQPYALLV